MSDIVAEVVYLHYLKSTSDQEDNIIKDNHDPMPEKENSVEMSQISEFKTGHHIICLKTKMAIGTRNKY